MFFYWICFFKQKTADEMRISDWSSDVCSSDLRLGHIGTPYGRLHRRPADDGHRGVLEPSLSRARIWAAAGADRPDIWHPAVVDDAAGQPHSLQIDRPPLPTGRAIRSLQVVWHRLAVRRPGGHRELSR